MKTIFLALGMTIALLSSSCKKSDSEWVTAEVHGRCCATYVKIGTFYYKVCEGKNLIPQSSTSISIQYSSPASCSDYEGITCLAADCIEGAQAIKITAVK